MARIRTIKPEFWTDEKIVGLSPLARLLFIGLWNFVDDEGRAPYSPARLKMQILPADNADISEIIGEIRGEGLIVVYEVDGKEYFQVCGFSRHQKIDKRLRSKHPAPTIHPEFPQLSPTEGIKEGIKEGKEEEERAIARVDEYPFEGRIIRLNRKSFNDWTKAFPRLDLRGELTARDAWLSSDRATPDDKKNWFISTSKYLANRNMEAGAKQAALAPNGRPRRGIEGIV